MPAIEAAVENGILIVTLNRPERRNAVTLAMWRELARIFSAVAADDDVRGAVLRGAGTDFTAGADISEFDRVRGTDGQSADYEGAVDAATEAIASCPKPTFAAIRGYCLGGGCHLAMACDFRFAEPSAQFGIPAARLSIVYGVRSTRRLLALVGLTNAKRILFSAERFGLDEAVRIGFAESSALDALADAKHSAEVISRNAPLSVAGSKAILNDLAENPGGFDAGHAKLIIDRASNSEDYAEGRRAFAEKRAPVFRNR